MITVTISHPNGQRQEVLLAGVPRVGESIRLRVGDRAAPALVVEHVLWMEGSGGEDEPSVLAVVRHRPNGPTI